MTDATQPVDEKVGVTAADLMATLSDTDDCDVYVSQALEVRMLPHLKAADVVWEGAKDCFFRLTPARFAGLVAELKSWKEALKELRSAQPTTPEEVAFVEEMAAKVEAAVLVMKDLKTEFLNRWPEDGKRFSSITPEELKTPSRAIDLWRVNPDRDASPIAVEQTASDAAAVELLEWASTNPAIPDSPFSPLPFAVVLDGPAWFARLVAHARASGHPKAIARIRRLKNGRARPSSPQAAKSAEHRRSLHAE